MAHRNRWFTVLKNGGSFHGYVSHNQIFDPKNQPTSLAVLLVHIFVSWARGDINVFHHLPIGCRGVIPLFIKQPIDLC